MEQRLPSFFSHPVVLCVVGLISIGALLGHQRELMILALLVEALMGVTFLWSRFAARRVVCELSVDRGRVYPDEPLALTGAVKNEKRLPVHFTLSLTPSDIIHAAPQQPGMECSGGLLGFQQAQFTWRFIARKRGIHTFGPPKVTVGDLLGYYRREIPAGEHLQIVVFPRLVQLKPFDLFRKDLFGASGTSGMVPDPLYIIGTRDYQVGHPARYIHWKASARRSRLQEKVCEPSFQEKLLFVIQVDGFIANHDEEAFERTLEVVASLSLRAQSDGLPVGLAANAVGHRGAPVMHPPAGSPRRLTALMETLAGMKMKAAGDIASAMESLVPLPWGMSCLLFCHRQNDEAALLAGSLGRRNIPSAMVVCDPKAPRDRFAEVEGARTCVLAELYDPEGEIP